MAGFMDLLLKVCYLRSTNKYEQREEFESKKLNLVDFYNFDRKPVF